LPYLPHICQADYRLCSGFRSLENWLVAADELTKISFGISAWFAASRYLHGYHGLAKEKDVRIIITVIAGLSSEIFAQNDEFCTAIRQYTD
jgi:predicted HAD superfamily hydrolase